MRGFFLAMMLIALLIVSFLVIKNLSSDTVGEVEKIEAVQQAKDVKQEVEAATQKVVDRLNKIGQ